MCEFMHHVGAVTVKTRREHQRPWNWSYRPLKAAMWLLRPKSQYFERAVHVLYF